MTVSLSTLDISAVVLDIEGTTTPIEFVYEVLFPYARVNSKDFLEREWRSPECRDAMSLLIVEHAEDIARGDTPPLMTTPPLPANVAAYGDWLMNQDRKSRGLKALQGLIWRVGYASGALRGQVYDDVRPALERWTAAGRAVYIYSSGSVLAQQLLFGSTNVGNLTPFLSGYFDTAIGAKVAPASYRAIVDRIGETAGRVLFVSDVIQELDAARQAGIRTALCQRDGMSGEPSAGVHPVIHSFDEVVD